MNLNPRSFFRTQSAKAPLFILESIKKNKVSVFLAAAFLLIVIIYPFVIEKIVVQAMVAMAK